MYPPKVSADKNNHTPLNIHHTSISIQTTTRIRPQLQICSTTISNRTHTPHETSDRAQDNRDTRTRKECTIKNPDCARTHQSASRIGPWRHPPAGSGSAAMVYCSTPWPSVLIAVISHAIWKRGISRGLGNEPLQKQNNTSTGVSHACRCKCAVMYVGNACRTRQGFLNCSEWCFRIVEKFVLKWVMVFGCCLRLGVFFLLSIT